MTANEHPATQGESKQIFLTTWCGGTGCDNCKLCLIFSGQAELIKADDKALVLTYRIRKEVA